MTDNGIRQNDVSQRISLQFEYLHSNIHIDTLQLAYGDRAFIILVSYGMSMDALYFLKKMSNLVGMTTLIVYFWEI